VSAPSALTSTTSIGAVGPAQQQVLPPTFSKGISIP
jgi:hypothetical protein